MHFQVALLTQICLKLAILQEFSVPARNYLQGNIQRVLIYGFVIFLPRGHLGLSGL